MGHDPIKDRYLMAVPVPFLPLVKGPGKNASYVPGTFR